MQYPTRNFLKSLICLAAICLGAASAWAINGNDNSTNYTGWATGNNGGVGFQPWNIYSSNHGGGSAYAGAGLGSSGAANVDIVTATTTNAWKLYAVDFNTTNIFCESIAFRGFSSSLGINGDTFAVSMGVQNGNNGVDNPGQIGFALRNGNVTGSASQAVGARLEAYVTGATNVLMIVDAAGTNGVTAIPFTGINNQYDFAVTLTGPNTYSLTITHYTGGTADASTTVTGTLAGGGTIDSFALFTWKNSPNSGYNSDAFFNKLAYSTTTCPAISLPPKFAYPLKSAAYSYTISATGGQTPYTYAVTSGSLPAGLSLSPAGVLSGTPSAAGLSTFTVTATDANGCTGARAYSLRVYATGVDDSSTLASWTGNGGTGFGAWSFYVNNHGSGFAGQEKNSSAGDVDIKAADGSVWKLYAIDFVATPQQEEAIAYRALSSPLQVSNDLFSVSMEMQNGNSGVGNPGQMGFALCTNSVITPGSANQTANARLAVYAAGGSNNLVVLDGTGTRDSGVPATLGSAYDFTVRLTGGSGYELTIVPYTNSLGATAAPVVITGTLALSGAINSFTLFDYKDATSTNSSANSDAYFNQLGYSSANFVCPNITLGNLGNPFAGSSYSFTVSAAGGLAPYNFSVASGTLPPGLTLSTGGVLSGTPTTPGTYNFSILAIDGNNCTGSHNYYLTVNGTGGDSSANYGSWTNGANAGAGFGPWDVYYNYHGSGFCGFGKATAGANIAGSDGSVWKLYAIDFVSTLQQEEATAYRAFNVPLSVAGDTFTVSFQNGSVGNPGQVGFALRNGDIDGPNSTIPNGSNNRAARARLQVYFPGGAGNLAVQDASGVQSIPGVGYTTYGYDVRVTLTGANTYSLWVQRYNGIGTADAPVTVTGTLAGAGPIDSLALFSWKNSTDSGANGDAYFNNLGYTTTTQLITNNVTFQVDMTAQIYAGNFNPATNAVEVRGAFQNWTAGQYLLTNNPALSGNASNIYSGVVPIVGAVGSGEEYKFVMNTAQGTVYESTTAKVSTPDTGADAYNRFFQLSAGTASTLAPVYFSDLEVNDYLPASVAVTFSVNMSNAVTTTGHTFDAASGDTVWVNGEFIPWYAWYDPVNPVAGPANYQLTSPGNNGIYSVTVSIPPGKPVAFQYKYGVGIGTNSDLGPRDNEAAVGQNHFRVVRSLAGGAYALPMDTFGNQYHEPNFGPGQPQSGQLTVGVPSTGAVPVSWLGRPGAYLQTASALTGPWVDQPQTDGTNWSSGITTTNGLMSVTNWPANGQTFFRLFKP